MSRGKRCDEPKLNIKKVIATIVAIIVVIMVIVSIKRLLTSSDVPVTKKVSTTTTYFPVYTNEKWGVIDNEGQIIINTTYNEMVTVPDKEKDLFICTYGADYENETYNTKVLNKTGEEILKNYKNVEAIENTDGTDIWYENDVLTHKKDGKYGLINFKGDTILDCEYDKIYAIEGIQKNLIIEKNGLQGVFNTSMKEIIVSPEYTKVSLLTDTYEDGYIIQKNDKYGVISASSKVILEPIYNEIKNVTGSGYYAVIKDGKALLINDKGETVLDSGFNTIEQINGENLVITLNEKYGIIDISGNTVVENVYDDLKYMYSTYYMAKKDNNYGIISTDGVTVLDFKYTSMDYIKTAGFIEANKSNYKTDLIDRNLKVVLSDVIVSELNIEEGYIRVYDKSEYNYYNFNFEQKTNKEVLKTNTLFLVKELGKYGYENIKGERIVDCIYDDAKEQNKYGYCAVKKDGKWGVLKYDGTIVVQPTVNLEDYLYVDFIGNWYLNKDINMPIYTK